MPENVLLVNVGQIEDWCLSLSCIGVFCGLKIPNWGIGKTS